MADRVSKGDVIAFRLRAHHLAERLGEDGLLDAAGQCGLQNSPPGSALLALHARVQNLTQERFAEAVGGEKSLLQTWSLRGAPFYFPTADASIFTTGVLPPTEQARRRLIFGVEQSLDRLELSLPETVELINAEIGDVLAGRRLAIKELGAELAERIAPKLRKRQRDQWQEAGPYAANQPLGEGVVHFCLRILTLQRIICFAPRTGNKAPFVLVKEIAKKFHREVWKTSGEPGTVLAGGKIIGSWRPRKSGRQLTITIKTFGSLPAPDRKALQQEAEQVAPLRGAASVHVEIETY